MSSRQTMHAPRLSTAPSSIKPRQLVGPSLTALTLPKYRVNGNLPFEITTRNSSL
jgi:hypothetical protein